MFEWLHFHEFILTKKCYQQVLEKEINIKIRFHNKFVQS